MDEKLRKDVEAVVAAIFSEKEEDDIRKQTEAALNKSADTIGELTEALEAKNTEVEELQSEISASEVKAEENRTKLEAAETELGGVKTKLIEAETALEEMKKDKATEIRMAELKQAGVVSDKDIQASKIRDMSDEDFASYKTELTTLREAILAELTKVGESEESEEAEGGESEEAEAEAGESEGVEAEGEESEEAGEEEAVVPAEINAQHAMSAALNLEIYPSKDMKEKYGELGKAMASLMVNK
jgi:hypothetical protein